jgi:hypothetical protein
MTTPSTDYRLIPLTQGQFAKVSPQDHEWLSNFNWFALWSECTSSFYASRNSTYVRGEKRFQISMHRAILSLDYGDKRIGDHVNMDTLDNRRMNLRVASPAENLRNRGRQENNTSGYKGVGYMKVYKKWRARIKVGGRSIPLGYFNTPEEAYAAYCAAAVLHHAEFARIV